MHTAQHAPVANRTVITSAYPPESGVRVFCLVGSACNRHHERDEGEEIPQSETTGLVLLGHSIEAKLSHEASS